MGRIAAVFIACLAACSSDGGGNDNCGEAGCSCTPEKGCDVGFECAASVEKCIPADCMPGFAACVCSGGQCTAGYACDDGVCAPGGATDGATSSPVTSGPTTTDPSVSATGSTSVTDASSSVSVDSGPSTSPESSESASASSSSGGMPTCADERDCEACLACAVAVIGPCAADSMACADDEQCQGLQTCTTNCAAMGDGGQCVSQCCGLFENGDMPPYSDLAACTNDACGDLCRDFAC